MKEKSTVSKMPYCFKDTGKKHQKDTKVRGDNSKNIRGSCHTTMANDVGNALSFLWDVIYQRGDDEVFRWRTTHVVADIQAAIGINHCHSPRKKVYSKEELIHECERIELRISKLLPVIPTEKKKIVERVNTLVEELMNLFPVVKCAPPSDTSSNALFEHEEILFCEE